VRDVTDIARRTLRVGDRQFRFLHAAGPERPPGQRGTLVLIHAFPLNAVMWEAQFGLTDIGWQIIAPDLRQFGEPNDDPPAVSVNDYATDILVLLDALHVDRAVVGGLSMGGYIAFALFRRAPGYVQAIVLSDTRAEADSAEAVENRRRALQRVSEGGAAAFADEMVTKLVGQTSARTHPAVLEQVRAIARMNSAAAMSGALTAMMTRPDSTSLLGAIDCPTLILVGAEDAVSPPAVADGMHHRIEGSDLVVIPEAGHLASLEQPAAFNEALARFLDHRV
jgi:3-oxoadipate enol-lactonase